MAKCLCRSLPLASTSSAFVQTPASLRNGVSYCSTSVVAGLTKRASSVRVVAENAAPEERIGTGQGQVGSRRRILSLGLLAATGLAASLAAPHGNAAEATAGTKYGEFTVAPSGLAYFDTKVGSGIQAEKGMLIKAHYTGKLENGKVFDSSYNRGKPLTFRVGVGEVIRGWDQGLAGAEGVPAMFAGGKRTLRIPSNLAYGERGAGCRNGSCLIPPNSTLIFDVEFVGKA
ncbi:hypothetical protein R1sor_021068 [Riccia sorocarpa]|uniref:peptidylprolyl isomerase n=1 Tax=Riccia sorocarpa TaxID=122646 RepID=A0ABD3GIW8_9MARC